MNYVVLLTYLNIHAIGYRNAKTQWDIEKAIDMPARAVRREIETLRRQGGHLIGSSPHKPYGYWMVNENNDEEEKTAYRDYLRRRHDKPIRELATLSHERASFARIFGEELQVEFQF